MATPQELFEQTLIPATTKQAGQMLDKLITQPGQLVAFFELLARTDLPPHIQLCATVYFKNKVNRHWRERGEHEDEPRYVFPEEEKVVVRNNIVDVLVQASPRIRNLLVSALNLIGTLDYPDKLQHLVPQLVAHTSAAASEQNFARLVSCLVAFHTVLKFGEFVTVNAKSNHREQVIVETFPHLLQIFQSAAQTQNEVAYQVVHWLTKILHSSFSGTLNRYWLSGGEAFQQWMQTAGLVLATPVAPEFAVTTDGDTMSEAFKGKKWILHTCSKLYHKYAKSAHNPARPEGTDKQAMTAFMDQFNNTYVHAFAEVIKNLTLDMPKGAEYPEQFKTVLFNVMSKYMEPSFSKKFKVQTFSTNDVTTIMFQVLFPAMCPSIASMEMFRDDPHEYVRSQYDVDQQLTLPLNAAMGVWAKLCVSPAVRTASLHFVTQLMDHYAGSMPTADAATALALQQKKEGALCALGCLVTNKSVKLSEEELAGISDVIRQHIFSDITTNNPMLKSRMLWTISCYPDAEFSIDEWPPLVQAIVQCLTADNELPLRVEAGMSLKSVLQQPQAKEILQPHLGPLLNELLGLMKDFGAADTVGILTDVIEEFQGEVAPYAVGLSARLPEVFKSFAQSDEGGVEERNWACASVLQALEVTLSCFADRPEQLPEVERNILPFAHEMLSSIQSLDDDDIIEELLGVLAVLLEVSPTISDNAWVVFPSVCQAVAVGGLMWLETAFPVLDKYITKGSTVLQQSPEALQKLLVLINEGVARGSPKVVLTAYRLYRVLALRCQGIDNCIVSVTEHCLSHLGSSLKEGKQDDKSLAFRDRNVAMITYSIIYNPALTLSVLESHQATEVFFTAWFVAVPRFTLFNDRKASALALTALIFHGPSQLPEVVKQGLNPIITTQMQLLGDLLSERAGRDKRRAAIEEWDDEEPDFDDGDFARLLAGDGDDDISDIEDEEEFKDVMEELGVAAARGNVFADYVEGNQEATFDANEFEAEHDFDDNTDDVLDLVYPNPLDNIDEVANFLDKLQAVQQQAATVPEARVIMDTLNGVLDAAQQLHGQREEYLRQKAEADAKKTQDAQ